MDKKTDIGAPAEPAVPVKMTDQDATKFDWWLLDYLRDQLFNPPAAGVPPAAD